MVMPFMGDDEGYATISKHMSAMQAELNALRKRRASSFAPEHQGNATVAIQRKKICRQANATATHGEPSEALDPRGMVLPLLPHACQLTFTWGSYL